MNALRAGANYGWPEVTGVAARADFVDPIVDFPRTVALTGCAWWDGGLYVGSYNDGIVRAIDPGTGSAAVAARSPGRRDRPRGGTRRQALRGNADGVSTVGTAAG